MWNATANGWPICMHIYMYKKASISHDSTALESSCQFPDGRKPLLFVMTKEQN